MLAAHLLLRPLPSVEAYVGAGLSGNPAGSAASHPFCANPPAAHPPAQIGMGMLLRSQACVGVQPEVDEAVAPIPGFESMRDDELRRRRALSGDDEPYWWGERAWTYTEAPPLPAPHAPRDTHARTHAIVSQGQAMLEPIRQCTCRVLAHSGHP